MRFRNYQNSEFQKILLIALVACFSFVLSFSISNSTASEPEQSREYVTDSNIALQEMGGEDEFWENDDDFFDNNDGFGRDFEDMSPAEQAITIAFGIGVLVILIAINVAETWLLYDALKAVPERYRMMSPGSVWLKLIPCFQLIWNFMAYSGVAGSYRNYFHSLGIVDRDDCGTKLGNWYSICLVLASIPCLNYCTGIICGPAALILLILFHSKIFGYKKEIKGIQEVSGPEHMKPPYHQNPPKF